MTERELIGRLKRGDPRALEELMDRFLPYVSAVAWNILGREDAEEVAADVFVAAWEHAGDLRAGKLKPWLGAVARNRARNRLRSRGRELPMEEELLAVETAGDPEDEAGREELKGFLRRCVEELGPPDRDIFVRHYYYYQTVAAIAAGLGMPENTVKTRLRRGRQRLRDMLREGGYCCEDALE